MSTALLLVALLATGQAAPPAPPAPDATGAHGTWERPAPAVQAEMDATLLPVGRGGILVPCMTDPRLEPRWMVLDDDGDTVGDQETGSSLVVPEGAYTVVVGSGAIEDRLRLPVKVHEGRLTVVPPEWAGLRVNVVNDRSIPIRGTYELLALPSRSALGVGFGAKVELGERVKTWLLRPGKYMLLKPGETYQARRDFFTFHVERGVFERLVLVMDEETGDFQGAGETQLAEEEKRVRDVWVSMVGGGGVTYANRHNVAGTTGGQIFSFEVFFDAILRWIPDPHNVFARLRVDESLTKQIKMPYQVAFDALALDGIYIYKWLPWLGPYARVGVDTKLFPGSRRYDEPTTVQVGHWSDDPDGTRTWVQDSEHANVTEFRLSNRFFPLVLDGGTGLNLDASLSYFLDVTTRLGVGVRQTWYDGLLRGVEVPDVAGGTFERVHDSFVKGFEGALILNARLTRWIIASAELEVIDPFDSLGEPVVDLYTNAGLRLSSFASLNYIVNLLYDRNVSNDPQVDQRLMLRFSYKFL